MSKFVIGADGCCGVVCEHSPFEGIVLVQCTEYLLKYMWETASYGLCACVCAFLVGVMTQRRDFWHQDRQPVEVGQSCERERTACTSQTALEVHARGSQTHRFFCRQAPEVWFHSAFRTLNVSTHCFHSQTCSRLLRLADNLDINVYKFPTYGKEFIKKQKMSPDAYIQVALQLAYYR